MSSVIVGAEEDASGEDNGANAPPAAVDARPATVSELAAGQASLPEWVKISAGWWAEGAIDDDTFVRSIQFLVQSGVIVVTESE